MTAALLNDFTTMSDVAKRLDPDGGIASVVEVLEKMVPELQDAAVQEGNLDTGHRITTRTALPSVAWRLANQGIAGSKSITNQIDEVCGQVAASSHIDPDVAGLGGNEVAYRASEDAAFVAAMGYEVASNLWYGNVGTNPEKMMGLAPRLSAKSGIDFSGQVIQSLTTQSGSYASAWWVTWGPKGVYFIFPKGSKAGLQHTDMGLVPYTDAEGRRFPALESFWKWNVGVCVEDYRQLVRVANISTAGIAETGTLLLQDLTKGYHQLHNPDMGKTILYINRTIATYLHEQAILGALQSTLLFERDFANGKPVLMFMGCPVRRTDSLVNSETILS
jgi:hypothetical protein